MEKEVRFTIEEYDFDAFAEANDPDVVIGRALAALGRIETPTSNRAIADLTRVRSGWVAAIRNIRSQLRPR